MASLAVVRMPRQAVIHVPPVTEESIAAAKQAQFSQRQAAARAILADAYRLIRYLDLPVAHPEPIEMLTDLVQEYGSHLVQSWLDTVVVRQEGEE